MRTSCAPLTACQAIAWCPTFKVALGGGWSSGGWGSFPPRVVQSYPLGDSTGGWLTILENKEPFATIVVDTWVLCALKS